MCVWGQLGMEGRLVPGGLGMMSRCPEVASARAPSGWGGLTLSPSRVGGAHTP